MWLGSTVRSILMRAMLLHVAQQTSQRSKILNNRDHERRLRVAKLTSVCLSKVDDMVHYGNFLLVNDHPGIFRTGTSHHGNARYFSFCGHFFSMWQCPRYDVCLVVIHIESVLDSVRYILENNRYILYF